MNVVIPKTFEEAAKLLPKLLPELRAAAEAGDVKAQKILGMMYAWGIGVPEDTVEAGRWYWSAAEQGDAEAQYILGVRSGVFAVGIKGIPKSNKSAMGWYRLAAEQGHARAQFALGELYATGLGVTQDYAEAERWLRLAAEQGDADMQYKLGRRYSSPDEPSRPEAYGFDEQTGKQLFRDTEAKEGIPINDAEAVRWFRRAAEQGHAEAQRSFGCFLARGRGIPFDLDEGLRWFRLGNENLGMSPEECDRSGRNLYRSVKLAEKDAALDALCRDIEDGIRAGRYTPAETLRLKGLLITRRNATRDYLDFAALSEQLGGQATCETLRSFDVLYPREREESALQQLQRMLANPEPYDLYKLDLRGHKQLDRRWHDWERVKATCESTAISLFD